MLPVLTHPAFLFLLAALGAAVPLLLFASRANAARSFAIALLLTALSAGCLVASFGLLRQQATLLDLSWLTPFPFSLALDRLSAFFLLLICAVALPVAIFAIPYFQLHYSPSRCRWTWAFLSFFLLSMIVVVTASSAFAFLAGWELMTLTSAALILIEGDSPERRHNIFIYLLMMHAGAAAVAASFFLFLPYAPGLDFQALRAAAPALPSTIRSAIFLAAFLGFGAKAGLIPLHLWLPRAHPIASSPVSALLSGIMLKTAVYGFVRLAFDFLAGGPAWSGYLVLLVAALSGLLGILYALAEHDLKRLLAYSSVENVGIIFLALAASLIFLAHHDTLAASLALIAALLHAFNHALFKSLLFLGAGSISSSAHSVDLNQLGGLQNRMPFTASAMLIASCSVAGLPLFNGFISEWLLFRSFLAGSALRFSKAQFLLPLMIGLLALISGLAAACFLNAFSSAFLARPRSPQAEAALEAPPAMCFALWLLASACLLTGIMPGILLRPLIPLAQSLFLGVGIPRETLTIAAIIPWIALIVLASTALLSLLKRTARLTPTWACGLPSLSTRMEYTSTAFSKPLRFVFARAYRPHRTIESLPADSPYFPVSISYRSVRTTSYERGLYRPFVDFILSIAHRLRRLQTGNIQVYLLYIFLALLSLLAYLRFLQ